VTVVGSTEATVLGLTDDFRGLTTDMFCNGVTVVVLFEKEEDVLIPEIDEGAWVCNALSDEFLFPKSIAPIKPPIAKRAKSPSSHPGHELLSGLPIGGGAKRGGLV